MYNKFINQYNKNIQPSAHMCSDARHFVSTSFQACWGLLLRILQLRVQSVSPTAYYSQNCGSQLASRSVSQQANKPAPMPNRMEFSRPDIPVLKVSVLLSSASYKQNVSLNNCLPRVQFRPILNHIWFRSRPLPPPKEATKSSKDINNPVHNHMGETKIEMKIGMKMGQSASSAQAI